MNVYEKIRDRSVTLADQEEALKNSDTAYIFGCRVPHTDIEKCQEAACKDPSKAYNFALKIPGANIEKCQEAACKDLFYAYWFAVDVLGADLLKIQQLCPQISDKINELIMERALR